MKNKQTYFTIISVLVFALGPVFVGQGYTGEVPEALAPIAAGITALISIGIRWYKENNPAKAEAMNL